MEKNCEKPELTPEELEALKKRHIRSFVMRRGHISAAQKRALDESLPQYQIEYAAELLDADKAFGRHAPLVLEIGCGMGETTAAIAQAHPEVNFLGCEVFVAGVGALAKRLDEMSLTNVRIVRHDAVEIVRDMIAENSLDGVHIYFPDPGARPAITSAASSPNPSSDSSPPAFVRAATSTAPRTGRTTPSRCSKCSRANRSSRTSTAPATSAP